MNHLQFEGEDLSSLSLCFLENVCDFNFQVSKVIKIMRMAPSKTDKHRQTVYA